MPLLVTRKITQRINMQTEDAELKSEADSVVHQALFMTLTWLLVTFSESGN